MLSSILVIALIYCFTFTKGASLKCMNIDWLIFGCFNAIFNNISAISWQRRVLAVEEAGVPGENQRPWTSNW